MTAARGPELQPGDVFAGYRIDGVAGRGGMGVVYVATDLALDRRVALKVIAPDLAADDAFVQRFIKESRTAASLEHPHVVDVFHAGRGEHGRVFLTMRFIEGVDLGALVRASGRLDPPRAVTLLEQVASALDEAHGKGLVHRDVKPANVLVRGTPPSEHAYLTDFGLVRRLAGTQDGGGTAPGAVIGSVDFIAPEQIDQAAVDHRADVYALAGLLYTCVTGQVPFPRETDAAKLFAHMREPAPSARAIVPGLPTELDEAIANGLAKDPAARPGSAGELAAAARRAVPAMPEGTLLRPRPSAAAHDATAVRRTLPDPAGSAPSTELHAAPPPTPPTAGPEPVPSVVPLAPPAAPAPPPPVATPPYGGASPASPHGGVRPPARRRGLLAAGAVALLAAVAVVLVLALAGGGDDPPPGPTVATTTAVSTASGPSPEEPRVRAAAEDFVQALAVPDGERACARLSRADRARLDGNANTGACAITLLASGAVVTLLNADARDAEIRDVAVQGDRATATIAYPNGSTEPLQLVLEDGEWRVDLADA